MELRAQGRLRVGSALAPGSRLGLGGPGGWANGAGATGCWRQQSGSIREAYYAVAHREGSSLLSPPDSLPRSPANLHRHYPVKRRQAT